MGASGADLLLSPAARRVFPFYVECKNQEALNIWAALAQADKGSIASSPTPPLTAPLVVFRRNKTETYAALPFSTLLNLVKLARGPA
jgi:hypothetical protein